MPACLWPTLGTGVFMRAGHLVIADRCCHLVRTCDAALTLGRSVPSTHAALASNLPWLILTRSDGPSQLVPPSLIDQDAVWEVDTEALGAGGSQRGSE